MDKRTKILTGIETALVTLLRLPAWECDVSLTRVGPATAHATTVGGGVGFVPAKEEDFRSGAGCIDPVQLEELRQRGRRDISR